MLKSATRQTPNYTTLSRKESLAANLRQVAKNPDSSEAWENIDRIVKRLIHSKYPRIPEDLFPDIHQEIMMRIFLSLDKLDFTRPDAQVVGYVRQIIRTHVGRVSKKFFRWKDVIHLISEAPKSTRVAMFRMSADEIAELVTNCEDHATILAAWSRGEVMRHFCLAHGYTKKYGANALKKILPRFPVRDPRILDKLETAFIEWRTE